MIPAFSDPIERLIPMRRPPGRVAMRQERQHLLFLHRVVPEAMLRPPVPPDLEIDTFPKVGGRFVRGVPCRRASHSSPPS